MNTEKSRIRTGLADWCDEAGAPRPGTAPPLRFPNPGRTRGRWFVPLTAAAAVLLVIAAIVLVPRWVGRGAPTPTPPARATSTPTLPRVFAGPSLLAAAAHDSPPGTAVALIGYAEVPVIGDLGGGQGLVVSADGKRYRSVTSGAAILSPDGNHAIVGGDGRLRLVDLRTGTVRDYRPGGNGTVEPSSYSPDGRRVVYQLAASTDNACPCRAIVIDLASGHRTTLAGHSERESAFSPDGKRVAIQIGDRIVLTDTEGHQLKRYPAHGGQLTSGHAWSPDGRLLALTFEHGGSVVGTRFLALTPGTVPPATLSRVSSDILGWADPGHLTTYDYGDAHPAGAVVVHDLSTGATQTLGVMRGDGGGSVDDIAANLLPRLATADAGDPDYGPWPTWFDRAVLVAGAIPVVLVTLGILAAWLVRRRRPRRPPATGSPAPQ